MSRVERALTSFKSNYSCSQSILSAYSEGLGLDPEFALRIAVTFGGGIARRGETCGAVTGALMVIGLRYGGNGTSDGKEEAISKCQSFIEEFESRHGTIKCKDLIGHDLNTRDGEERANAEDVFSTKCPGFVRTSAVILETML